MDFIDFSTATLESIALLNLTLMAFVNISGFQERFIFFLNTVFGDKPYDMLRYQRLLQESFLQILEESKTFHDEINHSDTISTFHDEINHSDTICEGFLRCVFTTPRLYHIIWMRAFDHFTDVVKVIKAKRSYDFDSMMEDLDEFSRLISSHMDAFTKKHKCLPTDDIHKTKFEHMKKWISSMMSHYYSDNVYTHSTVCDDNAICMFELPVPYDLCEYCDKERQRHWIKYYHDYCKAEKTGRYDVFRIDCEYEDTDKEVDEKEIRRDDFKKGTKGHLKDKRRYLRNKGLL
jgi:hypothetical protein